MRIKLREYQRSDIPRLVELINNKKVSQYLESVPFPYSQADAEWFIDNLLQHHVTRVIEMQDDNETIGEAGRVDGAGCFVGAIGIIPGQGWKQHQAEIGYWIGEPYWGKGIASIALQQFTAYCFQELSYRKLYAVCLHVNTASMRVLEKCGYQREGILRQEVYKNDQYYDIHHYSLLASTTTASATTKSSPMSVRSAGRDVVQDEDDATAEKT